MIYGIGVDTEEIARIEKLMGNPRFLERVYGGCERSQLVKPESFTANFCAKEALIKVIGYKGILLKSIELLRDGDGKPYYSLSGTARELCESLRLYVSVTHTKKYATVVCVAEIK